MKITNLLSITALFLSLSIGESYAVTKNGKVWTICAIGATGAATLTAYTAHKTKESFRKVCNWNIEEEIKKQHEKEANAHTMLEKFRVYQDSFFVNKLGLMYLYAQSAGYASTTLSSACATLALAAAPFILSDKKLSKIHR